VVGIHHRATNKNLNILLPQAKKTSAQERIINACLLRLALLPYQRYRHMILNTASLRMVTFQTHESIRKTLTDPNRVLIGMIVDISKIMDEVVLSTWHSVNRHRGKGQQLHAGIAGDAR
jgi:hypothetical protein